jgi:multidrug efflux pump subunit AcrA (membrane-fusion protein)
MTNRVVPEQEIVQARLALSAQAAEIAALKAGEQELQAQSDELQEQARQYEARIKEARTAVDRAQLALDRTRITAPVDGLVSKLLVAPGDKRMLGSENPHSAAIAELYEPESLQARIDVPLTEAGKLEVGQPVLLRSNILPDHIFQGTVTRIVGEADLQRNTLQAKVAIHNPHPRLRPEMLCRAEFLAAPGTGPGTAGSSIAGQNTVAPGENRPARLQIFIPQIALAERDQGEGMVWKLDESGRRIQPQPVQLGDEQRQAHLLVRTGLRPGERVVLDPPSNLAPGQRVRPVETDPANL